MQEVVYQAFKDKFGYKPQLISRAPGRINLIGEHTDYNGGYVFPAAVDKYIYAAIAKNNLSRVRIFALDLNQYAELLPEQIVHLAKKNWLSYSAGVYDLLRRRFDLLPVDIVYGGNVPIGAGMSSSAAVEVAIAIGLKELFGLRIEALELAKLCQQAEHQYAGVKCGIMDQFTSIYGKKNHFILLNSLNLDYAYHKLDLIDYKLVLINSNVKHELGASVYNQRRQLCEKAAKLLGKEYLVQASLSELLDIADYFTNEEFQMLEYVLEENLRVLEMVEAIKSLDYSKIGRLLLESHNGLSKKYKVSCAELDYLVELAMDSGYVIGARMMGGGFGGCTINLVKSGKEQELFEYVYRKYKSKFGIEAEFIEVSIVDGAGLVDL